MHEKWHFANDVTQFIALCTLFSQNVYLFIYYLGSSARAYTLNINLKLNVNFFQRNFFLCVAIVIAIHTYFVA